jgi:hypothetical protein
MRHNEEGAASVLVIFMMILLVTFGSMALSMGLANNRLGMLSTAWMQDYYALDARAEANLFQIDQVLNEAERAGQQILLSGGDRSAFAQVYAAQVAQHMTELAQAQGWRFGAQEDGQVVRFILRDDLRTANREQNKYLIVEVAIHTPVYFQSPEGEWMRDETSPRFTVLQWQEWQEGFELKDVIEFWDGTIPS